VVETKQQAETLRTKIINGESSLFQLADEFSIDPQARFNNGDLGWILQGSGMPEIESAIANLKNNEISPVIKTDKGYHIITVLERRTGGTMHYYQIKDKLRQIIINEKMSYYLAELQKKHQVNWLIMENDQQKARALLESKNPIEE
jgi:parvulin-like peptidyl-prolyl isomerase